MSSTLSPAYQAIVSIRSSIQAALKYDLPIEQRAKLIAPLLATVNLWAPQIPVMVEGPGPSPSANLVFAIRKDLFTGAQFAQNVLGLAALNLPPAFQDFLSFIQQLIEAQKVDKEKVVPKVRISFHAPFFPTSLTFSYIC